MNKKFAFTLPEVLIAFAILGFIAVIVIPTFMKFEQDKDIVSRLDAVRSTLAQATKMAETRVEVLENWQIADMSNEEIFDTYYKPFIQIGNNCTGGASENCWAATSAFNGDVPEGGAKYGIIGNAPVSFSVSNGINVTLTKTENVEDKLGVESQLPVSLVFMTDVNGFKGPNKLGHDVFAFVLTENGLLPAGTDNYSGNCNKHSELNDDYWDCSAKVLSDKKRDYI